MNIFSLNEWLLYAGLFVAGVTLVGMLISSIVFCFTGRKLKKTFEQEYGKPGK